MFCRSDFARSYRPPIGFAAARIDVRAFNVALMCVCVDCVCTVRFIFDQQVQIN